MQCKLVNENYKKDYIRNLLKEKGINSINKFLSPDKSCLQSYYDLNNIEEGIDTICAAFDLPAKIGIVVDCDADGFCSAAIIYQYLKRCDQTLEIIPLIHNGKQHGLSDMWENINNLDFDLIIAPDSSSNDGEYAKLIDCTVLALDHHLIEDDKPKSDNLIIINNQSSPKYNNKDLCGAGVTYQFCKALDQRLGRNYADDYIDLAGFAIIADMMSLLEEENQYIVQQAMKEVKNEFLWAILNKQAYSITGKMNASKNDILEALTPTAIAFYVVPLINAMIRVGSKEEKRMMFDAFIKGNELIPSKKRGAKGEMDTIANECARICSNIRTRQNKLKDNMIDKLEGRIYENDLLNNKILFIRLEDEDDFPAELNGLVCMGLSQRFKRPTIVARLNNDGEIKGSARGLDHSSLDNFKAFLDESQYFEMTAGHPQAFGISIKNSKLSKFHEYANEKLKDSDFGTSYYTVNFERLAADEDINELITEICTYNKIYGHKIEEPVIHIMDLNITPNDWIVMGANKDTLKIQKFGVTYMKFKAKDLIEELNKYGSAKLEIVGRGNLNHWGGNITPQIFIDAYEIKDNAYGF